MYLRKISERGANKMALINIEKTVDLGKLFKKAKDKLDERKENKENKENDKS